MNAPTHKFSARKLAIGSAVLASAVAFSVAPSPAFAQVEGSVALNILRECAKISDEAARLSCFDNNIANAGPVTRSAPPNAPQGVRSSVPSSSPTSNFGRDGFGREDIRTDARFDATPGELSDMTARVASITQRQPGIYAFTLEDGAQWVFTESHGGTYNPPRRGSDVVISRGALGGFLMRFRNQISVRVRRVE